MKKLNKLRTNVRVFIAQLVEHCSANAEDMGSNPVDVKQTDNTSELNAISMS